VLHDSINRTFIGYAPNDVSVKSRFTLRRVFFAGVYERRWLWAMAGGQVTSRYVVINRTYHCVAFDSSFNLCTGWPKK